MNLTGRTILITGGSAGIGLAFALKFVEFGNEVIVTGRRQAVLDEVKAKYPKLHIIQSDVADPAQITMSRGAREGGFPQTRCADEQRGHHDLQEPQGPGGRSCWVDGGDKHQRRRCNWHDLRVD